jgi:hypothetical protein
MIAARPATQNQITKDNRNMRLSKRLISCSTLLVCCCLQVLFVRSAAAVDPAYTSISVGVGTGNVQPVVGPPPPSAAASRRHASGSRHSNRSTNCPTTNKATFTITLQSPVTVTLEDLFIWKLQKGDSPQSFPVKLVEKKFSDEGVVVTNVGGNPIYKIVLAANSQIAVQVTIPHDSNQNRTYIFVARHTDATYPEDPKKNFIGMALLSDPGGEFDRQ